MSKYKRNISDPEIFRSKIADKLNEIINNSKISENLEKGIYNYSLSVCEEKNLIKKWSNDFFVTIYLQKLKIILINIKNKNILDSLCNKKIKAHELAFKTHQELRPDLWKELIEIKKIKDENKFAPKIEASTDDFTCTKCKTVESKKSQKENRQINREVYTKCTYYQLQTRSADEPMTTFVTCLNCGNRWRC